MWIIVNALVKHEAESLSEGWTRELGGRWGGKQREGGEWIGLHLRPTLVGTVCVRVRGNCQELHLSIMGKKARRFERGLRQSALKDLVWGVSASPPLSLECEAAATVWSSGSGSDTEGESKIKVASWRGRQAGLLRIRTTLEMTKVGACDVVSAETEMGAK